MNAKPKTGFTTQSTVNCQDDLSTSRETADHISTDWGDDSWCDDTAKLETPYVRAVPAVASSGEIKPSTSMIAPIISADASKALREIERMLGVKLKLDDSLDWDSLVKAKSFQPSLTPRPYIRYGEEGVPVDIEYLNVPESKPVEPVLPPKPVPSNFEPDIGILDRLAFRQQRLSRDARCAYMTALQKWESDRQERMAIFVRESNRWMESAKAVDAENAKRYLKCIEDQQRWLKQKTKFDERRRKAKASIDNFKQAYLQNDQVAEEQ